MSRPSDDAATHIGWPRAILTAAIVVAVGFGACVYAPNAVLTRIHSLNRGNLVAIATGVFFVALFVLAWALRRLQRRDLL